MSKTNEKRAAEILYALGYGPDEVSGILDDVTHALDDAKRRALLSLARWAKRHEKYAEEKFAASVTPIDRAFFRHYADNNHEVAAECRRRAKGNA